MENLDKSWNFKRVYSRPEKVIEREKNPQSLGKVVFYSYMCIYAEF